MLHAALPDLEAPSRRTTAELEACRPVEVGRAVAGTVQGAGEAAAISGGAQPRPVTRHEGMADAPTAFPSRHEHQDDLRRVDGARRTFAAYVTVGPGRG